MEEPAKQHQLFVNPNTDIMKVHKQSAIKKLKEHFCVQKQQKSIQSQNFKYLYVLEVSTSQQRISLYSLVYLRCFISAVEAAGQVNPTQHLLKFIPLRWGTTEAVKSRITGSCLYLVAWSLTSIFILFHLPGFLFVKFQSLHDSLCLQRNHRTARSSTKKIKT